MKRLVFVGAGHSHLKALENLASSAASFTKDVEILLMNDSELGLYSGMVPGIIASDYRTEEATIHYRDFCRRLGIQFQLGTFANINSKKLLLSTGVEIPFDVCSLNIGSQTKEIPSQNGAVIVPVKPLAEFLRLLKHHETAETAFTDMAVIGGGAAAVEIAVALQLRLLRLARRGHVHVFYQTLDLRIEADLRNLGIQLHSFSKVKAVRGNTIVLETDESFADFKFIANCTGAKSPFKETLIDRSLLSSEGFVKVDACLRVKGLQNVFAAGDCIDFEPAIAKSGVHAVRQGMVLSQNIAKLLRGEEPLQKYDPPTRQLYILTNGFKKARLIWGHRTISGRALYHLKRWIDRKYVRKLAKRSASR